MSAEHQIELFYDGHCPLCVREARLIHRRDKQDRILLSDISAPDFDPSSVGISYDRLMDRIHARLADGTVVEGVEAFRRVYELLGWGWLVPATRLPGLRQVLDAAYALFARNRLRLTGRCEHGHCSTGSL